MAETKPIPVRLPDDLIARLDKAAARIGNTRAGIIRFCVETWLSDFEKRGRASLPADWEEIILEFDNRRAESRGVKYPAPGSRTRAAILNDKGQRISSEHERALDKTASVSRDVVAESNAKKESLPSSATHEPTARKSGRVPGKQTPRAHRRSTQDEVPK